MNSLITKFNKGKYTPASYSIRGPKVIVVDIAGPYAFTQS